jgi:hypothetical protein
VGFQNLLEFRGESRDFGGVGGVDGCGGFSVDCGVGELGTGGWVGGDAEDGTRAEVVAVEVGVVLK